MQEECKKSAIKIIKWIAVILLGVVLGANLLRTSSVSYDADELVTYRQSFEYLISIPMIIVALVFAMIIFKHQEAKKLYICFALLYIVAGLYLILNTESFIRADSSDVWRSAILVRNGDFSYFGVSEYIGKFPFQLGFLTYDLILNWFSEDEKILYFVNLMEVLIINWFGYKIIDKLFKNQTINKIGLFMEFAFIPQLLFIMFGYGLIPGFCFFWIGIYFYVSFYREDNFKNVICMVICFAIATLLKPNYKIGVISCAIVLVLKISKDWRARLRQLGIVILLFVCVFGSFYLVKAIYSGLSGIDIGDGTPILVHIAMGTDIDNEVRGPGWFDESTSSALAEANYDTELASQNAIKKLQNNINKSISNPRKAGEFYWRKILSTWCEPMFQSAWSGPIQIGEENFVKKDFLVSLYSGGKVENVIAAFSKGIVILIFAFSLRFVLKRKDYPEIMALYLYFIGGFVFHFFSETKSQYVYMYVFSMIPMCAYELEKVMRWCYAKVSKIRA